jgi:hypothetical protein
MYAIHFCTFLLTYDLRHNPIYGSLALFKCVAFANCPINNAVGILTAYLYTCHIYILQTYGLHVIYTRYIIFADLWVACYIHAMYSFCQPTGFTLYTRHIYFLPTYGLHVIYTPYIVFGDLRDPRQHSPPPLDSYQQQLPEHLHPNSHYVASIHNLNPV